jgi:hypothetical protein
MLQQFENLGLHRNVERREGLVGDNDGGLHRKNSGDADALPLPPGEFVREPFPRHRASSQPAASVPLRGRSPPVADLTACQSSI